MNLTKDQIECAVNWWADRIKAPTFDNLGPTRGRDPEETRVNTFSSALAGLLADRYVPTAETVEKFKVELTQLLEAEERPYGLFTDYHPEGHLWEAAQVAGLHESRFPWKTKMWFVGGGVQVAEGYGAQRTEILRK